MEIDYLVTLTSISPINLFLTGAAPDRAQEFRNWATTFLSLEKRGLG
jgi:hypothetical protein